MASIKQEQAQAALDNNKRRAGSGLGNQQDAEERTGDGAGGGGRRGRTWPVTGKMEPRNPLLAQKESVRGRGAGVANRQRREFRENFGETRKKREDHNEGEIREFSPPLEFSKVPRGAFTPRVKGVNSEGEERPFEPPARQSRSLPGEKSQARAPLAPWGVNSAVCRVLRDRV